MTYRPIYCERLRQWEAARWWAKRDVHRLGMTYAVDERCCYCKEPVPVVTDGRKRRKP